MSKYKWILLIILATNLALNVWGIEWGLPERWHPDEVVDRAEDMYGIGTFNHSYYTYGALPYYQVMLLAVAPAKLGAAWLDWHEVEVRSITTMLARIVSALMGMGVVLAVYGIGCNLFDRRAGLISAALMGLTMGLVNISHFATVDIQSLFWFAAAVYFSVRAWRNGGSKMYVAAGICCGLATAVRFVGVLAIIVLAVAHWCRKKEERRIDQLVLGLGSGLIALLAANLPMVAVPCYFAIGYVKDFFFNGLRNAVGPRVWGLLIADYINAVGWPLAMLSFGGIVYAIWLAARKEWRKPLLLMAASLLPYYLVIGRMHVSHLRYALPLAPFLIVLAGKMLSDFIFNLNGWQRRFWQVVLAATVLYSLAYVVVADLNFKSDARNLFSRWLTENVSNKETIEMTSYASDTAQWFYNVTRRPHDNGEWSTREALAASRPYNGIVAGLRQIEKRAQRVGLCADLPEYQSWNESAVAKFEEETASFDLGSEGIKERRPEVLVVSELYYDRFRQEGREPEGMFLRDLFSGQLPYKLSEEIWYKGWPGVKPRVEFVNPKIRVYKYKP